MPLISVNLIQSCTGSFQYNQLPEIELFDIYNTRIASQSVS